MKLKNKVAVVTGGAQGFGKGIADRLYEEGAYLAIVDMNLEGAKETAAAALAEASRVAKRRRREDETPSEAARASPSASTDRRGKSKSARRSDRAMIAPGRSRLSDLTPASPPIEKEW